MLYLIFGLWQYHLVLLMSIDILLEVVPSNFHSSLTVQSYARQLNILTNRGISRFYRHLTIFMRIMTWMIQMQTQVLKLFTFHEYTTNDSKYCCILLNIQWIYLACQTSKCVTSYSYAAYSCRLKYGLSHLQNFHTWQ